MKRAPAAKKPKKIQLSGDDEAPAFSGTQTLVRGLEVIDVAARGPIGLTELAAQLDLTRSTTHRLAGTLVMHRYLNFVRGVGYSLGPRLLELGYLVGQQLSLTRVAHQYLQELATRTGDTVYLAILDGYRALYLDKLQGSRLLEVSSRIGERQPLRSTGLGKALILDANEGRWREYYDYEARQGHGYDVKLDVWLKRMREYAGNGYALDLGESDPGIRCIAAPIRDVTGAIVAAISVCSASQYMDDTRMLGLCVEVKNTAALVSRELGYDAKNAKAALTVVHNEKRGATGRRGRRSVAAAE